MGGGPKSSLVQCTACSFVACQDCVAGAQAHFGYCEDYLALHEPPILMPITISGSPVHPMAECNSCVGLRLAQRRGAASLARLIVADSATPAAQPPPCAKIDAAAERLEISYGSGDRDRAHCS